MIDRHHLGFLSLLTCSSSLSHPEPSWSVCARCQESEEPPVFRRERRRRRRGEGADDRRAEGAGATEFTPPRPYTNIITISHSSRLTFHYAHRGNVNIVAEGYTDWSSHTLMFPYRCTRSADGQSRGAAASFRDRATIGWCVWSEGFRMVGGTRADCERGALAAASALRHRSNSLKLAVLVTSRCGSRTHTASAH